MSVNGLEQKLQKPQMPVHGKKQKHHKTVEKARTHRSLGSALGVENLSHV